MDSIVQIAPLAQSPGLKPLRADSMRRADVAAGRMLPWFAGLAFVLAALALYIGFILAPTDPEQGHALRIVFIHVPAAWMSLLIYLAMALASAIGLVGGSRLPSIVATSLAPTGAMFTFMALWTGALWGKPTWGVWWVWDARLSSELLLLFAYLGFVAFQASIEDPSRADRASGILALVGVVNVPVVYFSVQWWNTLHQNNSVGLTVPPAMATTMLAGIGLMALAFLAYTIAMTLARMQNVIMERERWLQWAIRARGYRDELD